MKNLSRKLEIVFLSIIVILVGSACSEDEELEDAVPNSGIGNIQTSQVIAASPEIQHYYASRYSFNFNEDGLLSSIRNVQTGEIEVTYEYGTATRSLSEQQTRQTSTLSSGQVLMTIRQTDTYIFHLLFSIGGNGFANTCVETNFENISSPWKFSYNADGRLVQLNDDGDITSFKYDDKGRMISFYNHDSESETTFSYGDALCTPYPKNDMEWINLPNYYGEIAERNNNEYPEDDIAILHKSDIQNSLGLFPVVSDFDYEDPEFIFAYLAGLIGKLSSALPAQGRLWDDKDYTFLYLIEDDAVLNFRRFEMYEE